MRNAQRYASDCGPCGQAAVCDNGDYNLRTKDLGKNDVLKQEACPQVHMSVISTARRLF
ncbi:MAG: hypothetical protein RJR37_10310 [Peptococcaceae bacterium MAG4]|nr:hypothetical protein [Peptococcaceae bacterium MAG4]